MTITVMSAFQFLSFTGIFRYFGHMPAPVAPVDRQDMPCFPRFPCPQNCPGLQYEGQARAKFFGEEGEREGEAAPFVHKRGASPSLHPFLV